MGFLLLVGDKIASLEWFVAAVFLVHGACAWRRRIRPVLRRIRLLTTFIGTQLRQLISSCWDARYLGCLLYTVRVSTSTVRATLRLGAGRRSSASGAGWRASAGSLFEPTYESHVLCWQAEGQVHARDVYDA